MDGRVYRLAQEFIKQNYGVDFVDTITLSGACKVIAKSMEQEVLNFVKRCLNISVNKHGFRLIAMVGYYDCAGSLLIGKLKAVKLPVLLNW
ncbi:MAG: carbonic anhydrase [candidate division WOR-3 bacterium]